METFPLAVFRLANAGQRLARDGLLARALRAKLPIRHGFFLELIANAAQLFTQDARFLGSGGGLTRGRAAGDFHGRGGSRACPELVNEVGDLRRNAADCLALRRERRKDFVFPVPYRGSELVRRATAERGADPSDGGPDVALVQGERRSVDPGLDGREP